MQLSSSLRAFAFAGRLFPRRGGVASKVYAASAAGVVGLVAMAAVIAQFVAEARDRLQHMESAGLQHVELVNDLDTLRLAQRTLVLSVLSSQEQQIRDEDRLRLTMLGVRLETIGSKVYDSLHVPNLVDLSELRDLAGELAKAPPGVRDPGTQTKLKRYLDLSEGIDGDLRSALLAQAMTAQRNVNEIAVLGDRMAWWVGSIAVLVIGLGVPLLVFWVTGLLRRINRITRTMHRIADCETAIDVPSTVDGDEVGDLARAVQAFKRNTIALQRNSDEISKLNGWFDLALNNMQRGLSIFDQEQRLVMCNERYREIYDLPKAMTRPGTPLSAIIEYWKEHSCGLEADGSEEIDVGEVLDTYRNAVAEGDEFVRVHTLRNKRVIVVSYQPAPDGGWVDVHEDVTDRIQTDETIRRLAHDDVLTGLMNRQSFLDALGKQLEERSETDELSVLLIDMREFKRVNEVYGFKAGDEVLKIVSERLKSLIGGQDKLARISGDGFGIIKTQASQADTSTFARDVCDLLRGFVEIEGKPVEIGVDVGAVLVPQHGETIGELMQRAEIALYQAKVSTRREFVLFDPSLENAVRERQTLEADLKAAFELGQFELYYQPIVSLKERQVSSCEALMRWTHPVRGMVPPAVFIPIAEEIGLIAELGKWAIERACRDAVTWPSHVRVAVNLSAAQFQTGDIHKITHMALREAGLPAKRLELEVTESLLLTDESRTRKILRRLKIMGVSIALDDFGTGYASLSYLRSFPFDKIKIDQTFVRDLPRNADCNAIVRSVVALARMLGMRTVAEGIETPEHLNQVVVAGCDEIQGYHLSRPVPASGIATVIADCERRLVEAA